MAVVQATSLDSNILGGRAALIRTNHPTVWGRDDDDDVGEEEEEKMETW